jgi:hypothetical protein
MAKYLSKVKKGKTYNSKSKKIQTTWNRRNKYKKAFNSVINAYIAMHSRSLTKALDFEDFNPGNPNPIQPTVLDFICDVDKTISKVIKDKLTLRRFNYTFYVGEPKLDKEQISYFEQKLGQMFIVRHLWPVDKYFKVIRQKYEVAKS